MSDGRLATRTNAMTVHMRQTAPGVVRWSLTCEGCGETWDDEVATAIVRSIGVRPTALTYAGFWMHAHFFGCEGRK
jgi:hypothetical protein